MEITRKMNRQALVGWALRARNIAAEHGAQDAAAEIDRAIESFLSDRVLITVLGKAKRGKSTLINAILGRKDDLVAPVDKLPASSVITRFTWAATESATVYLHDGSQKTMRYDQIRNFVTEEFNPENREGVSYVEVRGPFPGLEKDLVLADTPGAGSIHAHHDQLLHAFIPESDAVIFLVTASMPIDQDELDLLKQVQAADIKKVFFAINKVDNTPATDIESGVAHNLQALRHAGVDVSMIHRISALEAFSGNMSASGLAGLANDIGGFLAQHKGRMLASRFIARVFQAASDLSQRMTVEYSSASKTRAELDADIQRLNEARAALTTDRAFTEREFTFQWTRALDEYEQALRGARTDALARLNKEIANRSMFELGALAKVFPSVVTSVLTAAIAPSVTKLEGGLRDAVERLQATYPNLSLQPDGLVLTGSATRPILLAGVAGGAAVAAGVGIAAAASAAAATAVAPIAVIAVAPLATAASGILSFVGLGELASVATTLGTTTTMVTAAAAPPLWAVVLGPIGWTIAGVGLLAVPLAWRSSKIKQRRQLEDLGREHIASAFDAMASERLPAFRRMKDSILEDFRLRLDRQLANVKEGLDKALNSRDGGKTAIETGNRLCQLKNVLAEQELEITKPV